MKLNNLKYFIALVAVISIVCSCDKNSLDTRPTDASSAIEFANVSTKAAVNDLGDLQDNGFGVWAYINNSTLTNSLHMDNIHVEYKEDEASWEYSPLKYWLPETVFNFIATYPYDSEGTYYTFDPNTSAVKLTVAETPSQEDFLIATNSVDTSDESFDAGKAVNLNFQHVLTSVGLNIWRDHGKHQNDQMRIRKVTLSNIRKAGTYSSQTELWTPSNDKLTLEKTYEGGSEDDNIGAAIVKDDGTLETISRLQPASPFDFVMLVPQTLDASMVSLKILYELKRQNAADWEQLELETYLPASTWESNRRYTYNVVLSSVTDITVYYIQTKVDPWGTPQVGGTVIIK